ncbi:MAG: EAL domain-containing protein [Marinobacter sp.]|nr:EAL domain-containing protein [Marinobacter sp.]
MKLTEFIRTHKGEILQVWDYDAKAILPNPDLSWEELRDHIEQILMGIVVELERPATGHERSSHFNPDHPDCVVSARIHGMERHNLGADIAHVTSEFSALRLTVAQLWLNSLSTVEPSDIEDLNRFNSKIDKALAQSVQRYALENQKHGRLFETMLSSLPDPCYILALDGTFIYANRAMAELCDLPADKIRGKRFHEMPLPAHYNGKSQLEKVVHRKQESRGEVEIQSARGNKRFFEYVYAPVIDDKGRVEAVSGIGHDITLRKQSEARIWRHANYDLLTNVPNQRLFRDRLDQHAAHSARTGDPFALLFIDLDNFKVINDRLGHDAGDELLKDAAKRINACVRQSDTVARMGGDEFTVLLLDTGNLAFIKDIARNILAELDQPFRLGDDEVKVSGSIGITLFPEDGQSAQQLLSNADQAMYLAKQSGRNQVCFYNQILGHARDARHQLVAELRQASEKQQLELYYQPIVELASDRIVKAEALLRWQHPERGLLTPGKFLGLAEETGLMGALEHWVFAEAAASTDRWTSLAGVPFQISVNTSPMQFTRNTQDEFREADLKAFARFGATVILEMPESVFLQSMKNLGERFSELQKAGVQLALDDFGTGHSSLPYLKRFNVNYLKLDPSFVQNDNPDSGGQTIAESIIAMAHKLGIQVIAKGVETAEQRDWLKEVGCDFAQGYFFSTPLPMETFSALLHNSRPPSGILSVNRH